MFRFFGHRAGGISAPQLGIELLPPALKGKVLTTGSGESLNIFKSGKIPFNSHFINLKENKQEHAMSLLQAFHSFSLCLERNLPPSCPGVKTPPGGSPASSSSYHFVQGSLYSATMHISDHFRNHSSSLCLASSWVSRPQLPVTFSERAYLTRAILIRSPYLFSTRAPFYFLPRTYNNG